MTPRERLRQAGLRATEGRIAVLDAVAEDGNHPDAARVISMVRERRGGASIQAVYDALAALTTAGLLRRIEPAGSPARFETRVGDNHHHLVCRNCGRIADVDCEGGAAVCVQPHGELLFAADETEILFWGTCDDCRS